jgi:hypothetical protein
MHPVILSSHNAKAHKGSSPYHERRPFVGRRCFCIYIKQEANSRAQIGQNSRACIDQNSRACIDQNSRACIGQNSRAQIASHGSLYLGFYASRRIKASPLYASMRIGHYCERFSVAGCDNPTAGIVCQSGAGTRTPVPCANSELAHEVMLLCVYAHRRIMRTILILKRAS